MNFRVGILLDCSISRSIHYALLLHKHIYTQTHAHSHTHIYIYIFVCVCVNSSHCLQQRQSFIYRHILSNTQTTKYKFTHKYRYGQRQYQIDQSRLYNTKNQIQKLIQKMLQKLIQMIKQKMKFSLSRRVTHQCVIVDLYQPWSSLRFIISNKS